jgi:hypothetical protein
MIPSGASISLYQQTHKTPLGLGSMENFGAPRYAIYGWEDYPRKILESALKSDSAAARDAAVRVIHLMGSRGQYAPRDLLRTQVP